MPSLLIGASVHPLFRSNADAINMRGKDRGKQRQCGELELDALECLESYGTRRGDKLCHDYVMDFKECWKHYFQHKRVAEMRRERIKQVMRGERKFLETMDSITPPRDSYFAGPFYN